MTVDFRELVVLSVFAATMSGCTSGPPQLPYPAFVVTDELPDAFVAGLPGVRAKRLSGDPRTRRSSNRVLIPADWRFTTGASPGQSVEIFLLAGAIRLGEFPLTEGGYAYIPPGSAGLQMQSENGATLLYFVDDANDRAVIRTPLITNSGLLEWQPGAAGFATKDLRADPGSGARTWLLKLDPGVVPGWQRSSQNVEGYLLSGSVIESECVGGEVFSAQYLPGGYFHRPPATVHGGAESRAPGGATWLLRVPGAEQVEAVDGCASQPQERPAASGRN